MWRGQLYIDATGGCHIQDDGKWHQQEVGGGWFSAWATWGRSAWPKTDTLVKILIGLELPRTGGYFLCNKNDHRYKQWPVEIKIFHDTSFTKVQQTKEMTVMCFQQNITMLCCTKWYQVEYCTVQLILSILQSTKEKLTWVLWGYGPGRFGWSNIWHRLGNV